jgi:hypothetical protein
MNNTSLKIMDECMTQPSAAKPFKILWKNIPDPAIKNFI